MNAALCFVEPESAEWSFAWAGVARRYGSDFAQLNRGECWQYMGTAFTARGWEHQFRHRCHPSTNERVYLHLPVSAEWTPPQQERKPEPIRKEPARFGRMIETEQDYGGAFDGNSVSSDADPGL